MKYIDPVAALIGGGSLALSLTAGIPVPAAIGVGAVVFAIADRRRLTEFHHRDTSPVEATPMSPALLHPDEQGWVGRADDAVTAIRQSILLTEEGPLRERLASVADDAEEVHANICRLAAQVTATRQASRQLDLPRLSTDLDRLTTTLQSSRDPEMARDLRRSIEAVREQLRIGRRLATARAALQARVEAGALGVQQLAAQVSEMSALETPGGAWQQAGRIDELTAQLEALRAGLSDAHAMSDRALAVDREGGDDDPVAP